MVVGKLTPPPPSESELPGCVVLHNELNFTGHRDLSALGTTHQHRLELVDFDFEVGGDGRQDIDVTTSSGNLEGFHFFTARLHVNHLSRLHAERGAVDEFAVDKNVAVDDHLTGLSHGAGKTGAEHERVEAHLQQLNEVFTAQSLSLTGFFEHTTKLCFTNPILGAQTLLLAQTDGVVAIRFALGATVLAGCVGTLFEVFGCLRRKGNPQSARQTGFASGTRTSRHELFLLDNRADA
jgi:hypothetical protein